MSLIIYSYIVMLSSCAGFMFDEALAFNQNLCRWDKNDSASVSNFCFGASCGTHVCTPPSELLVYSLQVF